MLSAVPSRPALMTAERVQEAVAVLDKLHSARFPDTNAPVDAANALDEIYLSLTADHQRLREAHVRTARGFSEGLDARLQLGSRASAFIDLTRQITTAVNHAHHGKMDLAASSLEVCIRTVLALGREFGQA